MGISGVPSPPDVSPLDDSPPVSTHAPPVCVLHRQRKAKYDGQIVLASPASTLALQVGPAHAAPARLPPPRPYLPRAPPRAPSRALNLSVQDQRAPSFRTIHLS